MDPASITNLAALVRLPVLRKSELPALHKAAPPFGGFVARNPGSSSRLFTSPADPDGDFNGAVPDPRVVAGAWDAWRAEADFATQFVAAAPSLDMTADEKVTTKNNDRAHLVFLDGTSLTVGPNSDVIIDKFVYDPDTKTGEMALNVSRGTLRFVGGVISKKSEVKIRTPVASMGIRGGILTVAVSSTGATVIPRQASI